MVWKSSSTQPFATNLPNRVGPPSFRRRDTPNSARRSSRMGAGAMIGPSSVLTCVEISDPTALGEKIAASLGGDDQSSYAECPEYGSCEVHYARSAHNALD